MLSTFGIILIICLLIQCIYYCTFWYGLNQIPDTQLSNSKEPVSVIITAKNEASNLDNLISVLFEQEYPAFEVILVDDCSEDQSQKLLDQLQQDYKNFKVITIRQVPMGINSKKYALMKGIEQAQHDLLLFTDADCLPESRQWIAKMAAAAQGKEIVLGFSDYFQKRGLLNYFIRFETLLTALQYLGLAHTYRPYMGVGRNLAYRKSFFYQQGGFNGFEFVTGGDDDLFVNKNASSMNFALAAGNGSNTISYPHSRLKNFYRQKTRHLGASRHYRWFDKIILGAFSLTYMLSWLLLPAALITDNELYIVLGSFCLRTLLLYITLTVLIKKLNILFSLAGLVALDLIYSFYLLITGFAAFFTKRVSWN